MEQDQKTVARSGRTWPWILLIIILIAGGAFALIKYQKKDGVGEPAGAKVIAVVNGEEITEAAFTERLTQLKKTLEAQKVDLTAAGVLDQVNAQVKEELINETLVLQDAAKKGIAVTDAEIVAELDLVKKRFATPEAFAAEVANAGFTEESFKANVGRQLLIQRYVAKSIEGKDTKATDAEVKAFYEDVKKAEGAKAPKLADIKSQIETQISQQKVGAVMQKVIEDLRSVATIENK